VKQVTLKRGSCSHALATTRMTILAKFAVTTVYLVQLCKAPLHMPTGNVAAQVAAAAASYSTAPSTTDFLGTTVITAPSAISTTGKVFAH